jgi:hypothetical protein
VWYKFVRTATATARDRRNFFIAQIMNEFRAKKKIRVSRSVAVGFWTKFEAQLAHLSQLGVPHTHNFEILEFLKNLRSQNFEISFENFQKMLDGSKFGKRCLLGISFQNYFQIWKILNFLKENLEFFLKKSQTLDEVRLGRS